MQSLRTNPASIFPIVPAVCRPMLTYVLSSQEVITRMRKDAHEARQQSKDNANRAYFGMCSQLHSKLVLCVETSIIIIADTVT